MDNLGFGVWMTAVGMGTAFALLLVLMFLLRAISWFDERSQRKATAVAGRAPAVAADGVVAGAVAPGLSAEDEAAIAVAVCVYAEESSAEPGLARARAGQAGQPWVVTTRGRQHDHYPRRR